MLSNLTLALQKKTSLVGQWLSQQDATQKPTTLSARVPMPARLLSQKRIVWDLGGNQGLKNYLYDTIHFTPKESFSSYWQLVYSMSKV